MCLIDDPLLTNLKNAILDQFSISSIVTLSVFIKKAIKVDNEKSMRVYCSLAAQKYSIVYRTLSSNQEPINAKNVL